MTCVYEFEAICCCPVDSRSDYYRVTVTSLRAIPVEEILKAAKEQSQVKQFQEAFTEALSRALCASVMTVGYHSGVKTTVTCA